MRTITRFGAITSAIVLSVGLAGYAAAVAQGQDSTNRPGPTVGRRGGPGGFRGPGGPGRMGPLAQMGLRQLNLTEAQQGQVRGILESHQEEQRGLGEQAAALRHALDAAITSGTFDEATVRTTSADLGRVETELAVLRAQIHAEIFQTLTTEQQSQLAAMQAERHARGQDRWERMQQRREQP